MTTKNKYKQDIIDTDDFLVSEKETKNTFIVVVQKRRSDKKESSCFTIRDKENILNVNDIKTVLVSALKDDIRNKMKNLRHSKTKKEDSKKGTYAGLVERIKPKNEAGSYYNTHAYDESYKYTSRKNFKPKDYAELISNLAHTREAMKNPAFMISKESIRGDYPELSDAQVYYVYGLLKKSHNFKRSIVKGTEFGLVRV